MISGNTGRRDASQCDGGRGHVGTLSPVAFQCSSETPSHEASVVFNYSII